MSRSLVELTLFKQIRDIQNAPADVLSAADDPKGLRARVSSEWRVLEKLPIGRRLPNGKVVACNHIALSRGDFVEVAATFDVAYRGSVGVQIHLNISQVIQILPASLISPVRSHA